MSYMNSLCEIQAKRLAELGERMGIGETEAKEVGRAYFWLRSMTLAVPGDKAVAKYQAQANRLASLCNKMVPKAALETWSIALAELNLLLPSHEWADEDVSEQLSGDDLFDWMNGLLNVAYLEGVSAALLDGGASSGKALSDLGRLGGMGKKLRDRDGKQAAKAFVYECWTEWEAEPQRYKGAAAFARSMLDKFPGVLTSQPVIEAWVRAWRARCF